MTTLQELEINYRHFLDRSTLLFGESGTGKSFVIVDILYQLKAHIDQILVISPTDRSNHTYDNEIVPTPFIHYTITAKLLEDIWERQSALASVYTKANKPEILKSLFDKISNNEESKRIIQNINDKLVSSEREMSSYANDPSQAKAKISQMKTECKKLILLVFKRAINANHKILSTYRLNSAEEYTLRFLNLNPRIVLIFDDCTDQIKKFKSNPVVQKLFYQGRWNYITLIIACHTDKALDPELKKNAFVSIFTEETCAHSYFGRPTNDLDRDAKIRAIQACKASFAPLTPHQKLAWLRDEKKFYRFTATSRSGFKFGSQVVWDYCNRISAEAGTVPMDNKFIHYFT